jgi:hypothetical protein
LDLHEGDVIIVTDDTGDWWQGECNGRKGWFPPTFVEPFYINEQQNGSNDPSSGSNSNTGLTRRRNRSSSNIEGGKLLQQLPALHSSSVQCMCKLPQAVWSATSEGSIYVWDYNVSNLF